MFCPEKAVENKQAMLGRKGSRCIHDEIRRITPERDREALY